MKEWYEDAQRKKVRQVQRPVVFLDRDGTLNEEAGYIRNVAQLVLIDGAASAIRSFNERKVVAILVTNQSGAARGYYPESHIHALNHRLTSLLSKEGAFLDALYYCPHLIGGIVRELSVDCQCRKPLTGMAKQAFMDYPELDQQRAYVIGDKATDVEMAHNLNAKSILVKTGYGQAVLDGKYQWLVKPDYIASDIRDASAWVLEDLFSKAR